MGATKPYGMRVIACAMLVYATGSATDIEEDKNSCLTTLNQQCSGVINAEISRQFEAIYKAGHLYSVTLLVGELQGRLAKLEQQMETKTDADGSMKTSLQDLDKRINQLVQTEATRTASQEALSTRLDKLFSQLNNLKEDEIEDDLKDASDAATVAQLTLQVDSLSKHALNDNAADQESSAERNLYQYTAVVVAVIVMVYSIYWSQPRRHNKGAGSASGETAHVDDTKQHLRHSPSTEEHSRMRHRHHSTKSHHRSRHHHDREHQRTVDSGTSDLRRHHSYPYAEMQTTTTGAASPSAHKRERWERWEWHVGESAGQGWSCAGQDAHGFARHAPAPIAENLVSVTSQ
eukprot:m.464297 g.464297  ORF g.464297 m.464297 type:complete len:347 (-) comp21616_c3_seq22:2-1042(-)